MNGLITETIRGKTNKGLVMPELETFLTSQWSVHWISNADHRLDSEQCASIAATDKEAGVMMHKNVETEVTQSKQHNE